MNQGSTNEVLNNSLNNSLQGLSFGGCADAYIWYGGCYYPSCYPYPIQSTAIYNNDPAVLNELAEIRKELKELKTLLKKE